MRHGSRILGLMLIAALLGSLGCSEDDEPGGSVEPVQLTFPFADPDQVVEVHNFALHPWSASGETHTGIDIVPPYLDLAGTDGMRKIPIVAPADGTILNRVVDVSGAGYTSYVLILQIDAYWHLMMVFEPQSDDAGTNAEQAASIAVAIGQDVVRGEAIGDLVVSRVGDERYPHLHFGVFYKNPDESWDDVYTALRVSDGSAASPAMLGEELGILSTFFCPYDYFLAEGQAALDAVPRLDMLGNACSCACSYGSSAGDCGACP